MSLEERIKYAEMKARHQKKLRPWYKKWWGAAILIIIGLVLVCLISFGFYLYHEVKRIQAEQAQGYNSEQARKYQELIDGSGNYILGTSSPLINIVEFTDFGCPYCQESAEEIRQLMEEYGNEAKLTIRDYPIHDTSIDMALAARCAGEQGKYWDAYDSLFLNQGSLTETSTITADLLSWSGFLGLDQERFKNCLDERRYINEIKKDYDDGNELGIQGTPTWFINYHVLTGHYPADKFKALFDGILQNMQK